MGEMHPTGALSRLIKVKVIFLLRKSDIMPFGHSDIALCAVVFALQASCYKKNAL